MATPHDNEATCSPTWSLSPTVELWLDEALCRSTSRDITIVICVVARCSGGGDAGVTRRHEFRCTQRDIQNFPQLKPSYSGLILTKEIMVTYKPQWHWQVTVMGILSSLLSEYNRPLFTLYDKTAGSAKCLCALGLEDRTSGRNPPRS